MTTDLSCSSNPLRHHSTNATRHIKVILHCDHTIVYKVKFLPSPLPLHCTNPGSLPALYVSVNRVTLKGFFFILFAEERRRYGIFVENMKKIEKLQAREKGTAKYGITKFADMPGTYDLFLFIYFVCVFANLSGLFVNHDGQIAG